MVVEDETGNSWLSLSIIIILEQTKWALGNGLHRPRSVSSERSGGGGWRWQAAAAEERSRENSFHLRQSFRI